MKPLAFSGGMVKPQPGDISIVVWHEFYGYLTSLASRRKISPIQGKTHIPYREMNSRQVYDA
jgi:hypothetical protein